VDQTDQFIKGWILSLDWKLSLTTRLQHFEAHSDLLQATTSAPGPVIATIATVVLSLVICVFLCCQQWKNQRDKKFEQELDPDPELPPAPSQVLPPDHVQNTATPAPSVQKEKPPSVQFAWGQMSAPWPRGKVASFAVESGSFEVFGHQYSIEHADEPAIAQFRWGDGTLQLSDGIDRNSICWRTNHRNPDWQRFLWVCTLLPK
jgi:hypothetical protein